MERSATHRLAAERVMVGFTHPTRWQRVGQLQASPPGAAVTQQAGDLAAFLRDHIKREATGLFPIARVALTAPEKSQVLEAWRAGHKASV